MITINFASSRRYFILATQHTNELAEELGYNIAGDEFFPNTSGANPDGSIRGYVHRVFVGTTGMKVGPITLHREDYQEQVNGKVVE